MFCRFLVSFSISFASLIPAVAWTQTSSTAGKYQDLIHKLLEESLHHEIEAIKQNGEPMDFGKCDVYLPQMRVRGRAGEHQQNERLLEAIIEHHEERNRERSRTRYTGRLARYSDRESSLDGINDMIRQGQLERVHALLDVPQWDQQRWGDSPRNRTVADQFWLACKLAAAYHRVGDAEQVRACLNLVRKIQEGEEFTGKKFDADNDWIPETPLGFSFNPTNRQRLTFYWTLVQSGHTELAIRWFLADHRSQRDDAMLATVQGPRANVAARFVELVATRHSAQRASELADQLYGKSIPVAVHSGITQAALLADDIPVAMAHVEATLNSLGDESVVVTYGHVEMVGSLFAHGKHEYASTLLDELVRRIERYENALRAGHQPPADLQGNELWSHDHYALLAREVVQFDEETALKLVDLFERAPGKGEWERWVLIESIKAQCGKISPAKHDELTGNCFADDLIGAYIDSRQMELARQTIKDAAVPVRQKNSSGNVVAGNGLSVLDYNAYQRILLARRAVHFEDFQLARDLLDEIPGDYSRREGFRAVALRSAETWGVERTRTWIEETENPISKSGAMLGLVEFLLPQPAELDDIPKVSNPGC